MQGYLWLYVAICGYTWLSRLCPSPGAVLFFLSRHFVGRVSVVQAGRGLSVVSLVSVLALHDVHSL